MEIKYITNEEVILTHDLILSKTGGLPGLNNSGLISSVVEHIKNDTYYPKFTDKLTHLMYSIIMNHAFNDANKRTSIACSVLFLNKNGYDCFVDEFIVIMEDVVVQVAEKTLNKDNLKLIIENIIK